MPAITAIKRTLPNGYYGPSLVVFASLAVRHGSGRTCMVSAVAFGVSFTDVHTPVSQFRHFFGENSLSYVDAHPLVAMQSTHNFFNYFFTITGFHGGHVTSGVIFNILILVNTVNGVYERRGHYEMIEKIGLYWHFVDLVWVFVFTCFYLL
jgi:cytochrome c oxidase subunit 3